MILVSDYQEMYTNLTIRNKLAAFFVVAAINTDIFKLFYL